MKRLLLIGRSGAGKTTLTQRLRGEGIKYQKTQGMNFCDFIIDSPGEYAENNQLGAALALYSYEADVVGLLIAADEDYSLFPPNITCLVNREVIGIVTKIDKASPERAARWLRLAGCKKIFFTASYTGKGIEEILEHLKNNKKQQKTEKTKIL